MKNIKLRILGIALLIIATATFINASAFRTGDNIAYTNQSNTFTEQQFFNEISTEMTRYPISNPNLGLSYQVFEGSGRFHMWFFSGTQVIQFIDYVPNQALYLGQNGYPILPSQGTNIDLGSQYQKFRTLYVTDVNSNRIKINNIRNCKQLGTDSEGYLTCVL